MRSDAVVTTRTTLFIYEPEAEAPDTGSSVGVSKRSGACSVDRPAEVFISASKPGQTCELRIQADGNGEYAPFDAVLTVVVESSGNVSWKVAAEPEWPGCYAPGATVGTMRIEAAAGTDSLEGLSADVSRPLELSSYYADGGRRWETRISVRGDAEPGTAKLEISYEEPGQFVSTADEPTRRDYTIDTNC